MYYYMTMCSTRNGKPQLTFSSSAFITAETKRDAYEKLFANSYLVELFTEEFPDISYDEIHVLFCKVY